MKLCSKCKNTKPFEEFYKNRAKFAGYCGYCKQCDNCRPRDKDRTKQYRINYRLNNLDKIKEIMRNNYLKNKELYKANNREWIENNKERFRELGRINAKKPKTKQRHRFQEAKRRAQKLNATPSWADMQKIRHIYDNCPVGYHIDHIIPLNHPLVCGLHVPWNLQYLPALENIRKNNKVEGLDVKI